VRYIVAVALLGATCTVWAAVPLPGTGAPGVLLLVVAAVCVAAGLLRLVRKDSGQRERYVFPGLFGGLAYAANDVLLRTGWETGAAVSVIVLEALHPSRPWHTGILAIAVACYLLAVHQAESAVPAAVFRGQSRVLLASLALVVVATAAAMVPASSTQSGWLEILAALAAMTAGGLALPL
jgi:phosphatidylserine synthase